MTVPKPEIFILDQTGLGRVPSTTFDHGPRYMLAERPLRAQTKRRQHWIVPNPRIDQGATSQCVVYTGDNLLRARPVCNKGFLTAEGRTREYKEVQKLDQWPGEDYDGSSILGLMRRLQVLGMIKNYGWARTVEQVMNHVLHVGPLAMGTTWTTDMFTPDKHGYIRFTGEVVGGHAWTLVGGDLDRLDPLTGRRGAVRKLGSWGPNWGDAGRAWITLDDLQKLLDDWGEAATAIELKGA